MELYIVVALGAMLAGFVQGLSGFGFGLTAMSVWAWTVSPQLAAVLSVFGSLLGQLIAFFSVQRGYHWARLLPLLVGGLLGMPLGVWLLPYLDVTAFKAVLGLFLALWCPFMLLASQLPRIRDWGGRWADGLVGAAGGIMGGLGGFTGALPTLWCTLRGLPKDEQRAVIQNFNLGILAATMVAYLAAGRVTSDTWPYLAVVAPAMLIPSLLGARLYIGLSDLAFRRVVLSLLTLSGLALLASSVPELLRRF